MKNKLLLIYIFYLINISIFAQQSISLDNALQVSAQRLINELTQDTSVAIFNFNSSSEQFSDYVIEELMDLLINSRKFNVVERKQLDIIRQEMDIQMSGYISDETMLSLGHNIGAKYIISGSLIDLGNTYRFRIFAINVETTVREVSLSVYLSINDDKVAFLITGQELAESSLQAGIYTLYRGGDGLCRITPKNQLEGRIEYLVTKYSNGGYTRIVLNGSYLLNGNLLIAYFDSYDGNAKIFNIQSTTMFSDDEDIWIWFLENTD
jgi:TolB-like protein